MINSIGVFLRKLRIDRRELLRDMANKLNVSSAFLSAVENGKKKFPDSWVEKLRIIYSLDDMQLSELRNAILESGDIVELSIRNKTRDCVNLAVTLARRFDSLDDETSKKIVELLDRRKED
ncbi:MAG: helix-turn-helix transcriptional regulator [Abditibacteriota bacterium]|nr:helix-turn-helix transcriptional regulator [Abditibacteriota bacterium]